MCKSIGIIFFLAGSVGLLCWQYCFCQERSRFLQEMNQSILRLHQNIAGRNLPVMAALYKENGRCDRRLEEYYKSVCAQLGQKECFQVEKVFMEAWTSDMISLTKAEERQMWVQALCSLFLVDSPGEDAGFLAYYESFSDMLKKDYSTKKERQKVTACTTGMGLLLLLLLLL